MASTFTYMASPNQGEHARRYAVVAEVWQDCDDRSAFDRTAWATRAAVEATLAQFRDEPLPDEYVGRADPGPDAANW